MKVPKAPGPESTKKLGEKYPRRWDVTISNNYDGGASNTLEHSVTISKIFVELIPDAGASQYPRYWCKDAGASHKILEPV